jgi:hypothetical protein
MYPLNSKKIIETFIKPEEREKAKKEAYDKFYAERVTGTEQMKGIKPSKGK